MAISWPAATGLELTFGAPWEWGAHTDNPFLIELEDAPFDGDEDELEIDERGAWLDGAARVMAMTGAESVVYADGSSFRAIDDPAVLASHDCGEYFDPAFLRDNARGCEACWLAAK